MATATLTISAPSTSLPPLKKLDTYSPALLSLSVRNLSLLYHPASASAPFHDSGYSSASNPVNKELLSQALSELEEQWESARVDGFERDFALRWLLGLISRGEEWVADEPDERMREDKERLLDDAAALLAACSRTSEAGSLRREYTFAVGEEGRESVSISTRDESYDGDDHTAVGVQTWASSTILAEVIARRPAEFGFPFGRAPAPSHEYTLSRPCRILELGAGTGVLSLLLAALATSHNPTTVPIEIVSSDYHPSVLSNLSSNLLSNFPSQPPHLTLSCDLLDWSAISDDPQCALDLPFDRPFDVIVGADIIYEPAHCAWIYAAVKRLLRADGVFHLIMPDRITHEVETRLVRQVFPFADKLDLSEPGREKVLAVTEATEMEKRVGKGRADEVKYHIFRLQWV